MCKKWQWMSRIKVIWLGLICSSLLENQTQLLSFYFKEKWTSPFTSSETQHMFVKKEKLKKWHLTTSANIAHASEDQTMVLKLSYSEEIPGEAEFLNAQNNAAELFRSVHSFLKKLVPDRRPPRQNWLGINCFVWKIYKIVKNGRTGKKSPIWKRNVASRNAAGGLLQSGAHWKNTFSKTWK